MNTSFYSLVFKFLTVSAIVQQYIVMENLTPWSEVSGTGTKPTVCLHVTYDTPALSIISDCISSLPSRPTVLVNIASLASVLFFQECLSISSYVKI